MSGRILWSCCVNDGARLRFIGRRAAAAATVGICVGPPPAVGSGGEVSEGKAFRLMAAYRCGMQGIHPHRAHVFV